ncbi:hypothetical protein PHET_03078 [Paragonimus heterotremus]|uniref:KN motif and ankyrin repeat domain-containing protein n=1 Tax=Paragonimus heterotremus TaxID=100268 RepID=A0A8J4SR26_9TREM|nr:hypothetical protein PHET_03078 [Paragonimus heterotremus]
MNCTEALITPSSIQNNAVSVTCIPQKLTTLMSVTQTVTNQPCVTRSNEAKGGGDQADFVLPVSQLHLSPDQLIAIRKQLAASLSHVQELESQVRTIPLLHEKIAELNMSLSKQKVLTEELEHRLSMLHRHTGDKLVDQTYNSQWSVSNASQSIFTFPCPHCTKVMTMRLGNNSLLISSSTDDIRTTPNQNIHRDCSSAGNNHLILTSASFDRFIHPIAKRPHNCTSGFLADLTTYIQINKLFRKQCFDSERLSEFVHYCQFSEWEKVLKMLHIINPLFLPLPSPPSASDLHLSGQSPLSIDKATNTEVNLISFTNPVSSHTQSELRRSLWNPLPRIGSSRAVTAQKNALSLSVCSSKESILIVDRQISRPPLRIGQFCLTSQQLLQAPDMLKSTCNWAVPVNDNVRCAFMCVYFTPRILATVLQMIGAHYLPCAMQENKIRLWSTWQLKGNKRKPIHNSWINETKSNSTGRRITLRKQPNLSASLWTTDWTVNDQLWRIADSSKLPRIVYTSPLHRSLTHSITETTEELVVAELEEIFSALPLSTEGDSVRPSRLTMHQRCSSLRQTTSCSKHFHQDVKSEVCSPTRCMLTYGFANLRVHSPKLTPTNLASNTITKTFLSTKTKNTDHEVVESAASGNQSTSPSKTNNKANDPASSPKVKAFEEECFTTTTDSPTTVEPSAEEMQVTSPIDSTLGDIDGDANPSEAQTPVLETVSISAGLTSHRRKVYTHRLRVIASCGLLRSRPNSVETGTSQTIAAEDTTPEHKDKSVQKKISTTELPCNMSSWDRVKKLKPKKMEPPKITLQMNDSHESVAQATTEPGKESSTQSVTGSVSVAFLAACQTFAAWLEDSTNITSKAMNEATCTVRTIWFAITSRPTANEHQVEEHIKALQSLPACPIERVVNMVDSKGNTALHYAVSNGRWLVVGTLLSSCPNIDVDKFNQAGYTPSMLAAVVPDQPITPEEVDALEQMLSRAKLSLTSSTPQRQSVLMLAAMHGRASLVHRLVQMHNAPINQKDADGSTALMAATEHNRSNVVRILLYQSGIDAELKDNDGCTALDIALARKHHEIALMLYAKVKMQKLTPRHTLRKSVDTFESFPKCHPMGERCSRKNIHRGHRNPGDQLI